MPPQRPVKVTVIGYYGFMTRSTRYRMYIDESGDHVVSAKWSNPDNRYLGLTGVVIDKETYRTQTHPEFWSLKQGFFPHDPDDPVILVRNRIAKKLGPFGVLSDPGVATNWEKQIIRFLNKHVSQVFTVVVDKQAHRDRYGPAAHHPYNYCAAVLTERYIRWLQSAGARGDVLAESRGGKEDRDLKSRFREVIDTGTEGLPASELQEVVTSRELKMRNKEANITGLQLADLIVYPATRDILQENGQPLHSQPSQATRRIIDAIRPLHGQDGRMFLP